MNQKKFDKTIGKLDRIMSKLMGYASLAKNGKLDEPNRQTLKHHAEDMEACAKAIMSRLGRQAGTPQPKEEDDRFKYCSKDCKGCRFCTGMVGG